MKCYYKITNARLLPPTPKLILVGDIYWGYQSKNLKKGILLKDNTTLSEILPVNIKDIPSTVQEDLLNLSASPPEYIFNERGFCIIDKPKYTTAEVDFDLVLSEEESIDFIITGLEKGEVGSLISAGGTGKSMIGLELSMKMALGLPSLLTNKPTSRNVCYLSLEDKIKGVSNRTKRIAKHMQLKSYDLKALKQNLRVIVDSINVGSNKTELNALPILDLFVGKESPDLLIIDTARRLHHLNENDSADMSAFISLLEAVGEHLGCAVLLLHHASKSSTGAKARGEEVGSEAARGSGAIVDNGRGTWYLYKMPRKEADNLNLTEEERQNYLILDHTKCNAERSQKRKILKRNNKGIIVVITPTKKPKKPKLL